MTDQPKYQTLRDYLRVIRAQRWLILLFVLLFGGAAFAYSAQQEPVYDAEASLVFKDVTQDLDLLGVLGVPRQSPEQRAAVNAERVTRAKVAERVKEALDLSASVEVVQDAVTARPEARTNFVVIQASTQDPEFSARLANEFATQVRSVVTDEERDRYRQAEESLRDSLRRAQRSGLDNFTRSVLLDRIGRLEALQDFGEPVDVARFAEAPANPSSPATVRNTMLGLLVGLTFGLLAAFARDSLDVRLRGTKEIQAHVKLPLLGHVGSEAMGMTGALSRNGTGPARPEDLEAFRILRKNLDFLDIDHPAKVIAITSPLPEEGKSTVAASLAAAYAQAGKQTLLVECDLRRPQLASRLGIERQPGLTDYLVEAAGPQEVLQGVPVAGRSIGNGKPPAGGSNEPTPELVCITAGSPTPRPGDVLGSKRFHDFLEQVRDAYDVVLLDTSPILSVADTLELLPHVDGAILCVRAGQTRRDEARAAKNALEHLPDRPVGLVVTGIKPGDEADYGYYSSAYAYGSS